MGHGDRPGHRSVGRKVRGRTPRPQTSQRPPPTRQLSLRGSIGIPALGETRRQSVDTSDTIGVVVPISAANDDPPSCLRSSRVHTWFPTHKIFCATRVPLMTLMRKYPDLLTENPHPRGSAETGGTPLMLMVSDHTPAQGSPSAHAHTGGRHRRARVAPPGLDDLSDRPASCLLYTSDAADDGLLS